MKLRRPMAQVGLPLSAAIIVAAIVATAGASYGKPSTVAQASPPSPSPPSGSPPTPSPSSPARLLYLRDCAFCHGPQGEGTDLAPSLIGVGAMTADFWLSTGRMPEATPKKAPPRRPPAYEQQQIAELVRYVASLGPGPPIPQVNPGAGNLPDGAALYEVNCAACHSSAGTGGALTQGKEAPSILSDSPTQIAEAIRLGGIGNMPVFGPDTLDQRQVDSIVRYIQESLQHPRDSGGLALGHVGPIAEGFIAWVVGVLLLVAFIRWAGTRAKE